MKRILGAIALTTCWTATADAQSAAGRNMAVATRALSFVEPRLAGSVSVAIVYQAGDADSESDARQISTEMGRNPVRGATFQPKLVSSASLSDMGGAKVVFMADGLRNQAAVAGIANRQQAISLSFDMSCVDAGRCVLGVRSSPKVEIVVSRAARQASGARFSQAFLMLVTER